MTFTTLETLFICAVFALVVGGATHWAIEMVRAFKRERRLERTRRPFTKP